jgi:phosphate acetyltransferase
MVAMAGTHVFYVVPTGAGAGLTSVALGIVRALDREGLRVRFFKPIRQPGDAEGPERSTHFVRALTALEPPEPMTFRDAEARLAIGDVGGLLEAVVARFQEVAEGADVVVVEGLVATGAHPSLDAVNAEVARALDAEVVFVGALGRQTPADFNDRLATAAQLFGGAAAPNVWASSSTA